MKKEPVTRDWESIEKDYRANVLSIREVGRIHSVSDKAIRNRAGEFGWERDLSAKVAEKVRSELVRSESAPADPKKTEQEIVDAAAATVVHVVRSHRARIRQGNELTELLTKQLADVAGKREEFETAIEIVCAEDKSPERVARLMRAVSLDKHAAIACNLANATKTWVGLERQAFGIEDGAEKDTGNTDNRRYTDAELAVQMAYILSKQQ